MNTISLVLFGTGDRYWCTLPTALIGYAELYPSFRITLHHSTDAADHPVFPFVQAFAQRTSRIDLVPVDRVYAGTEPTLWRMLPLWDDEVDLWLCRDIDSVPTVDELRAVRVFARQESAAVHGIRS